MIKNMKDQFIKHILGNYQHHCMEQKLVPGIINFIEYLMAHQLITEDLARQYVVLEEYQVWSAEERFRTKTQTIHALATEYDLHVNSIWNLLKAQDKKFKPRKLEPRNCSEYS